MAKGSSSSSGNAQRKTPAVQLPPCGYVVLATKKGTLPVSVEKRPKGKKVTIISNVQGYANALLAALGALLGTGGTTRQEKGGAHWTIEIQGDHTERLAPVLADLGCVRGLKPEPSEANANKKEVQVVSRICGYDKFLRRGATVKRTEIDRDPMPGADCRKWHGPWLYCRGTCFRADCEDVFEEGIDGLRNLNADGADAGATVESLPELNLVLREMGMFAEPGAAVRRPVLDPDSNGKVLASHRKAAPALGASFDDDDEARLKELRVRAMSQRTDNSAGHGDLGGDTDVSHSTAPPKRQSCRPVSAQVRKTSAPQPKMGRYTCAICEAEFSLAQTLKMHTRRAHPGQSMLAPGPRIRAQGQSNQSSMHRSPVGNGGVRADDMSCAQVLAVSAIPSGSKAQSCAEMYCQPDQKQRFTLRAVSPNEGPHGKLNQCMQPCPICLKDYPARELDSHVAICEELRSRCPTCGKSFNFEEIDSHVHQCLDASVGDQTSGASAAAKQQKPDLQVGPSDVEKVTSSEGKGQARTFRTRWQASKARRQIRGENTTKDDLQLRAASCANVAECPASGKSASKHGTQSHVARSVNVFGREHGTEVTSSSARVNDAYKGVSAGMNVEVVGQAFEPQGAGCEGQIRVFVNDRVRVIWKQPSKEGGFWAYGELADGSGKAGYFPLASLRMP